MEHIGDELTIDQITIDAHIQMRAALDRDTIDEYAEAMEAGQVIRHGRPDLQVVHGQDE
jgi:hypothetical protein